MLLLATRYHYGLTNIFSLSLGVCVCWRVRGAVLKETTIQYRRIWLALVLSSIFHAIFSPKNPLDVDVIFFPSQLPPQYTGTAELPRKKTSLRESLAESYAYNPIRDSGKTLGEREKSRQESRQKSHRESRLFAHNRHYSARFNVHGGIFDSSAISTCQLVFSNMNEVWIGNI